jgi:hypothetical protein
MRYKEFLDVFKSYHGSLKEYKNIKQAQQQIIKTLSGLNADDKEHAKVLDRIYKLINTDTIGGKIDKALIPPSADEKFSDQAKAKARQDVTHIISQLESNYKNLGQLLKRLETGGIVNIAELSKPINSFSAVFGDQLGVDCFISLASYGVGVKQKGPGEFGFAMLSNKIRLSEGQGDLDIDGIGKVELKAAKGAAGGRIGYGGMSQEQKRGVLDKYAEQIPTTIANINPAGSIGIVPFLQSLYKDLSNNPKLRQTIALELIQPDMGPFAGPIVKSFGQNDLNKIVNTYIVQNFEWYRNKDNFDALLVVSFPNKKTAMIKNAKDIIALRDAGQISSTSISAIPTKAGAGREQWAQLSLTKAGI